MLQSVHVSQTVPILKSTLDGLKRAYIHMETAQGADHMDLDAVMSWVDAIFEEAGLMDEVRAALAKDWEERRKHAKSHHD